MCAVFRWACQTNQNPFDPTEAPELTDYPDDISEAIEEAFLNNVPEIVIRTGYRIDLAHKFQIHVDDSFRQRPILRRCFINGEMQSPPTISSLEEHKRLEQRYGFNLEVDNTDVDTHYQGSENIMTWFTKVSPEKSKLSFDEIFSLLIKGIKECGAGSAEETDRIITDLQKIAEKPSGHGDKCRLEALREQCVKLYTREMPLYKIINRTLRANDESKMDSIGPICFLLYEYIGKQAFKHRIFSSPISHLVNRKDNQRLTVYRGDRVSASKLNQYREAVAGTVKNCFKWVCFASTSRKQKEAVRFTKNTLYHIDLSRYKSNDQYADISGISSHPHEQEILLSPGVRFRVDRITRPNFKGVTHVHIHILPSQIAA